MRVPLNYIGKSQYRSSTRTIQGYETYIGTGATGQPFLRARGLVLSSDRRTEETDVACTEVSDIELLGEILDDILIAALS